MRYFLPFLIVLLSFAACKKPSPHLSPAKMQQVLSDIYIAESYSMVVNQDSTHKGTEKNLDSLSRYYREIFNHHHITPQEFAASMRWYERNPEELDSVFSRMLPELSKQQGIYGTER